ncbi:MAG: hypothetical protein PVJ67_02385 [Candidatus Pacearchaeota archaeon]|jgi:hypothetical protein
MKRGQVWVETVIYTLIALIMIGTVISVVKPKIEAGRDQAVLDQSLGLMKTLDSVFKDLSQAPGNQRIIELGVKKGNFIIDAKSDKIIFEMESKYQYSEPWVLIDNDASGITFYTEKIGKINNVTLTKDYSDEYNLSYFAEDKLKILSSSSNSYKATILNRGHYQFTDLSSNCSSGNTSTCTNPQYSVGFSKYCIANYCKYVQEVLSINIDID